MENDKEAVKQMNRLLKIILSILIVYKPVLNKKISSMPDVGIDERNLRKPYFGSQQWGPLYKNIDIGDEEDSSRLYSDQQFSSFEYIRREDCPSWTDPTVERDKKPHFNKGRAFYSCSSGSCLKGCCCIPCTNQDRYH